METLFGEMEEKNDMVLKIKAKGQKVLTKNQQLFNNLTKRIEFLENDIVAEEKKLFRLLQFHAKKVHPLEVGVAEARINLAMTIDKATLVNKFTKKQLENIGATIAELCDDAFADLEPNEEQQALYDKWADIPLHEEMDMAGSETKEVFSDIINNFFGLDINMDDFDGSPEGFAHLQEKIKAGLGQSQERWQQNQQRTRKKTKKQQDKEDALKAEEDLKSKSIRSIYIALAKILHPDTESDTEKKLEKEELMKKVTVAYDQKDLTTLLRLEMEWVHKTSEHLEKLTEDKLKIYISTLKQQMAELQNERMNLYHHPRYVPISHYAHLTENYAINKISKEGKELKTLLENLKFNTIVFGSPNSKKEVVKFCKEFCENLDDDYDDIWGGF